ncbi:DUF4129 domain-containing protein [Chryseobacterium sp.]|uniref:DUF4129 domain-containing protein n=1 Tax=Chryseobacterium sp. TaxID=1871047 RepID=UPI0011C90B24|nr:DUF4129 domain-containing protein [Chryseobacterium sp.]TXF76311.1 DUF4129 domain-containing protein [Chryseobacterium sp.]
MNYKIIPLFFCFFFIFGFSQESPPPPIYGTDSLVINSPDGYSTDSILQANPTTENTVFPKQFKEKFRSQYRGAEFDYTTIKPRESFIEKIKKFIRKIVEAIFGNIDPGKTVSLTENIIRFFAVIIIGFVLYFLVRFLIGKNGNYFFRKKKGKIKIDDRDLHENIHEINFPETIDSFERQKDYRSAVRYRFLSVLKMLADKKLIAWNPEKTNKDYAEELKDIRIKNDFRDLVYIFDYVWYGEFVIDEVNYNYFKEQFQNFKI